MFRLYDARTGRPEPVRPARQGQLHTYLASPVQAGRAQAGDLRPALLADLIRRVAERHHLHVSTWQREPAASPAEFAALNIHPAQAAAQPPAPVDVGIAAQAEEGPGGEHAHWVWPADTRGGDVLPGGLAARGLDPLALRLLLLEHHHQQPADLAWDALAAADRELRTWRRRVAEWAMSPSKPMCAQYVGETAGAFDDDLDTPAALRTLRALAGDETIPDGSRFEAFAHLDHLFGLDLARDVGR